MHLPNKFFAIFLSIALICHANKSAVIISNFDTLPSDPVLLTEADLITAPYDGLKFAGFSAREDGLSVLRSHSPNNTAASSTLDQQLAGAGPPNITSAYSGSCTISFAVLQTYIGCAVTSQASLGVPQPCQLLFTGIKLNGQQVEQPCSYSGTALNPALQLCTFGSNFKDLILLVVKVASSLTVPTTTVLYLDDFKHINYYK